MSRNLFLEEIERESWAQIEAKENRPHVFTYSIRYPKQTKSGEFELVIKEFLFKGDLNKLPNSNVNVKQIGGYGEKKTIYIPEKFAERNMIWFYGNDKMDHYNEAVTELIKYQKLILSELEERYSSRINSTRDAIAFLEKIVKVQSFN